MFCRLVRRVVTDVVIGVMNTVINSKTSSIEASIHLTAFRASFIYNSVYTRLYFLQHMIKPRNSLGVWILLVIAVIPFLILYLSFPPFFNFSDFYSGATTVGKSFGLLAIMSLSINIFMSARYKFLEKLFGGLDWVYTVHSRIGRFAYAFLTTHILLLGLRYLEIDPGFIPKFFQDIETPYIVVGKAAVVVITFAIAVTAFSRLKYEIKKSIHRLMGLGLLLAGAHVYIVPSDVAIIYPLRVYILFWAGVAVLSFIHRSLLGGFLFKKYEYVVKEVNKLGGDVVEVVLKPRFVKRAVNHVAGQFQFITFYQDGFIKEEHPFTISSGEGEQFLRISVKDSGDFTSTMSNLKKGAKAIVEGPFGGFTFRNASYKRQIWIAGGIGITPFLSMARTLGGKKNFGGHEVHLFYTYSRPQDGVFVRELKDIAKQVKGFYVYPICTSKVGRLNMDYIVKEVGDFEETEVFVCGPGEMVNAFRKGFNEIDIKVRSEKFKLL